jgi:tRNA dimethylallyltransferase
VTIIRVIIGPTASGKSAFALEKAHVLNGVIINCDAMQSYDALHRLTAQPDESEQSQAPHRLYGFNHPNTHYSAVDWRNDAIREIDEAFDNHQTPILCGGTGFYLKSLMEGLSPMPDIPDDIRAQGIALQSEMGNPAFHEALKKRDPETCAHLDPMNTQRNIRAWEVLEYTGKPLSYWQSLPLIPPPENYRFHVTAILPDREKLYEKINSRTHVMLNHGILDEVRALDDLIQTGEVKDNALVVKAHGFRPFRKYLNNEWSLDEAIEHTQTETRQYAKRQMTWLRNQLTIDKIIKGRLVKN